MFCHTFDVLQFEHAFHNLKCEPWRVPWPGLCNELSWRTGPCKGLEVGLKRMRNFEVDAHQQPTWKSAPEACSGAVLEAWWSGAHFWWIWLGQEFRQGDANTKISVIFSNVLSYVRCSVIRTCIHQFEMRPLTYSVAWFVQWHVLTHRALWEEHEKM